MSRVRAVVRGVLHRIRPRYVIRAAAVVAVLAVLWWVATLATQVTSLSRALDVQRQQAVRAGQSPAVPDSGQIRKDPAQPLPSPGPSGPAGPGPTDAQVYAAVSSAMQAHPEWIRKGIDPAVLGAYVVNYLREHPPKNGKDGKPPTAAQISDAVLAVYQANPPSPGPAGSVGPSGPAGPKGDKGDQGPGPTDQQVADSVARWFEDHPLPTCPDGTSAQAHHVLVDDDGNPLTHETADAVLCVVTSGSSGGTG